MDFVKYIRHMKQARPSHTLCTFNASTIWKTGFKLVKCKVSPWDWANIALPLKYFFPCTETIYTKQNIVRQTSLWYTYTCTHSLWTTVGNKIQHHYCIVNGLSDILYTYAIYIYKVDTSTRRVFDFLDSTGKITTTEKYILYFLFLWLFQLIASRFITFLTVFAIYATSPLARKILQLRQFF